MCVLFGKNIYTKCAMIVVVPYPQSQITQHVQMNESINVVRLESLWAQQQTPNRFRKKKTFEPQIGVKNV